MGIIAAILLAAGLAGAGGDEMPACAVSPGDREWIGSALDAWDHSRRSITAIRADAVTAILFDADCQLTSATAMTGGERAWAARAHGGTVQVPGGSLPAQVTSFAGSGDTGPFFVMALPSLWKKAEVEAGPIGLERLMIAVLVHEASHVAQGRTYGAQMDSIAALHSLPDDFDDDSIQRRFEGNAHFSRSVERETELLFEAAAAPSADEARALAGQALDLLRARRSRWFAGEDAHYSAIEDIWLTMEGSGQWAGLRWLAAPGGGGMDPALALAAFGKRGSYWSQRQGLALVLALDRIDGGAWRGQVFGDGARTATQLLDEALRSGEPRR